MVNYETLFLYALALTIGIETACLFVMARYLFRIKPVVISNIRLVQIGVFAQLITLPFVWFVFPRFIHSGQLYLVASELFAFILEAVFYRLVLNLGWKKSLMVSLACNVVSFLVGIVFLR